MPLSNSWQIHPLSISLCPSVYPKLIQGSSLYPRPSLSFVTFPSLSLLTFSHILTCQYLPSLSSTWPPSPSLSQAYARRRKLLAASGRDAGVGAEGLDTPVLWRRRLVWQSKRVHSIEPQEWTRLIRAVTALGTRRALISKWFVCVWEKELNCDFFFFLSCFVLYFNSVEGSSWLDERTVVFLSISLLSFLMEKDAS